MYPETFFWFLPFVAAPPVDLDLTTIFAGGKAAKCPIKGTHTLAILLEMLEFRFSAFLNENSQAVLCFCWNSCLWLVADCRSCFWDSFVPLLSTAKLEPLFYFGLVRFTLLRLVTDVTDYQGGQEGIFARSLLSKSSSPQYHQ